MPDHESIITPTLVIDCIKSLDSLTPDTVQQFRTRYGPLLDACSQRLIQIAGVLVTAGVSSAAIQMLLAEFNSLMLLVLSVFERGYFGE